MNILKATQKQSLPLTLKVSYATKERKYVGPCTFHFVSTQAELTPAKIVRFACGSGASSRRYYYLAYYPAPDDCEFVSDGFLVNYIDRKLNPKFNPKSLTFDSDVCVLTPN